MLSYFSIKNFVVFSKTTDLALSLEIKPILKNEISNIVT